MTDSTRVRVTIVGIVCVALFSALVARLWFLQVSSGETFAAAAEANSTRVLTSEAPRGRILDRDGAVLVDNGTTTVVSIARDLDEEDLDVVVGRLADLLAGAGVTTAGGELVTTESVRARYDDPRQSRFLPAVVASEVPDDVVVTISERSEDFPGVDVAEVPVRTYPNGTLAAHVLGYVGEIGQSELDERDDDEYQLGDTIGRAGAEGVFEEWLRGESARMVVEVDPANRRVPGDPIEETEAVPGRDVRLTLDLEVQRVAEEALAEAIRQAREFTFEDSRTGAIRSHEAPGGAVVAIDVRDGAVVALASHPVYPAELFVGGIPQPLYDLLQDPEGPFGDTPLLNRATQGQYAPGSTFKLVTALAALEDGYRTPTTTIVDEGRYVFAAGTGFERVFRNAGQIRHGAVDLRRAMTVSSDVYFYEIGAEFWCGRTTQGDPRCETIQDVARRYGFGSPTGIPLSEVRGRVPDRTWKEEFAAANYEDERERREYSIWLPGDNINLSIGQGDLVATPLQLANAYAAFANGGTRWEPRLGASVTDRSGSVVEAFGSRAADEFAIPPDHREAVLDGLTRAVADESGTAYRAFEGFPLDLVPVAGKTGTAEVSGKGDTSLFAAIVPAPDPQYAVVVVVEEAGFGSRVAAPVARQVIEALYELPRTPIDVPPARPGVVE